MSLRTPTWMTRAPFWRVAPPPQTDLTLDRAPVGVHLQLKRLNTNPTVTRRLVELGLTPQVTVRIVQDSGGPIILAVRGSRIALGREMARQVTVRVRREV